MKKLVRPILWAIFAIYCVVLIDIIFLSRPTSTHYTYAEYFRYFTNFIPFKTIYEYTSGLIRSVGYLIEGNEMLAKGMRLYIENLVGNFVLFVPMGMSLPCLFKKLSRFWKVVLCVLGIVVLVEVTQGLLRVGSIDIDDVIFNVSGTMIGYAIINIPFINKLLQRIDLVRTNEEAKYETII